MPQGRWRALDRQRRHGHQCACVARHIGDLRLDGVAVGAGGQGSGRQIQVCIAQAEHGAGDGGRRQQGAAIEQGNRLTHMGVVGVQSYAEGQVLAQCGEGVVTSLSGITAAQQSDARWCHGCLHIHGQRDRLAGGTWVAGFVKGESAHSVCACRQSQIGREPAVGVGCDFCQLFVGVHQTVVIEVVEHHHTGTDLGDATETVGGIEPSAGDQLGGGVIGPCGADGQRGCAERVVHQHRAGCRACPDIACRVDCSHPEAVHAIGQNKAAGVEAVVGAAERGFTDWYDFEGAVAEVKAADVVAGGAVGACNGHRFDRV